VRGGARTASPAWHGRATQAEQEDARRSVVDRAQVNCLHLAQPFLPFSSSPPLLRGDALSEHLRHLFWVLTSRSPYAGSQTPTAKYWRSPLFYYLCRSWERRTGVVSGISSPVDDGSYLCNLETDSGMKHISGLLPHSLSNASLDLVEKRPPCLQLHSLEINPGA
jgi:hypothetical protein